jgi:hypothetical protein
MAVDCVAVTAAGLTSEVVEHLRGPLGELGFEKRSGEIFTVEVADGVLGWLGLNRAYRRVEDRLEVNPVIGVRHQDVERMVAELRAEKFHPYQPPTVSTHLGYLTPERKYTPWLFQPGATITVQILDLVSAIARFGIPFVRSSTGLDELRQLIEEKTGFAHQLAYRHPVVCLLGGDRNAALRVLEASLDELGDRADAAAVELRSFGERFRARVDQAV